MSILNKLPEKVFDWLLNPGSRTLNRNVVGCGKIKKTKTHNLVIIFFLLFFTLTQTTNKNRFGEGKFIVKLFSSSFLKVLFSLSKLQVSYQFACRLYPPPDSAPRMPTETFAFFFFLFFIVLFAIPRRRIAFDFISWRVATTAMASTVVRGVLALVFVHTSLSGYADPLACFLFFVSLSVARTISVPRCVCVAR